MRERVEAVFQDPAIRRAFRFLSERETEIEADQIRLTTIPAPPFGEAQRAVLFAEQLRAAGLQPAADAAGNVIAPYDSPGTNPLVIAAHLDTVFPLSLPLEIQRRGRIVCLPGISDNGSGLAALLWCVRAARECGIRFRRPVLVVGNVGEEGEGNLRGIRHVFDNPPWKGLACDFIAVDGSGLHRVTHQALGSRRFRVRMKGPGGHSWADFGRPNPIHAMAAAVHQFCDGAANRRPGTSFNVGVIRGGISVNAIPCDAVMEIDLRSVMPSHLDELDQWLTRVIADAAVASGVEYAVETMGERPSGTTPPSAAVVQAALEATRRLGIEPQLDVGSTDANIPMSMGIPAIALGAGGSSGNIHTPEEWFDPLNRDLGLHRLLAITAVLAGFET